MATTYHENYGTVSKAQLALYRKYNVSPSDHYDLVDVFGTDRDAIVAAVKGLAAENDGFYNPTYGQLLHWKQAH